MKEINLKLTVDEVNTILKGLGDMPYQNVFQLINKIQQQASEQLQHSDNGVSPDIGNDA